MPAGVWDCDVGAAAGGLPRNSQIYDQFIGQYAADNAGYTAAFGMADADLSGDVSLAEFLA